MQAELCLRLIERDAIGSDPQHGQKARRELLHLVSQAIPTCNELARFQLIGGRGRAFDHIRDAISEIEQNPLRLEERTKRVPDGAGGLVDQSIKFPVWFDPVSSGGTPMCDGLKKAAEVLVGWCNNHAGSYPPTVIHVSDGQASAVNTAG